MSTLQIIDADTAAQRLGFADLIDGLQRGFRDGCQVPPRHHHTIAQDHDPDATLLLMPAWSNADDAQRYLGIKIVTVVPGNSARGLPGLFSTYVLYDAATGQQLALIDGNTITGRRTVATSALAARYLARPDASKLLVIGAGRIASLIPDAYRAVRPIEHVDVWNIDAAGAETLVRQLNDRGIRASVAPDLAKAVANADIVSAATLATAPLVRGEWLRPGTHLDLIGGFTPVMREADDEAIRRSSIYVDVIEGLHEAGDLVQPIASGVLREDDLSGTLAQLTRGHAKGRRDSGQITCFKAVGSGLADLVAATLVYRGTSA